MSPNFKKRQKKRIKKLTIKFQQLISALSEREIPETVIFSINEEIDKVNQTQSEQIFTAQLSKSYRSILKIAEKQLNLYAKDHYRNMWLALGLTAFGILFGFAISAAADHYGLIGVGLPIGFGISKGIGTKKDKEAFEHGRQLNVEM